MWIPLWEIWKKLISEFSEFIINLISGRFEYFSIDISDCRIFLFWKKILNKRINLPFLKFQIAAYLKIPDFFTCIQMKTAWIAVMCSSSELNTNAEKRTPVIVQLVCDITFIFVNSLTFSFFKKKRGCGGEKENFFWLFVYICG